jgi:probable HAF family extracellular repeat protein
LFLYAGGTFVSLGRGDSAHDINDSGWVVGTTSSTPRVPYSHAFLYRDGVMTDIHQLGSYHSEAFGINSAGQVVGQFALDPGQDRKSAFVYFNGKMCNLNELIPAGGGWWLSEAWGINDLGQIVGNGFRDGRPRGFLLTPEAGRGAPNPCAPASPASPPLLRVSLKGRTQINPGNRYSEDAVVQAEVVFPPGHPRAGQIDRSFQGAIRFSEGPETHYYDGVDGATALPASVNATDGVATLRLSSVSVSPTGGPPPPASVNADCGACLPDPAYPAATIPQWVDGDSDGFADWLESWANDLLGQMRRTPGEVGAVARSVSRVEPAEQTDPELGNVCGYFVRPTSVLRVSPNCGGDPRAHRRNRGAQLSETILHESRHAWQFAQVLNPAVDSDADRLRNRAAQFPTPFDPAGVVPPAGGCNYIEERCAVSLGGSGRDDSNDALIVALACAVPNHGNVSSCARESDAYAFGRAYKLLFP